MRHPRSIACPACGYQAYYNPKPVAAAIPYDADGRIWLLRRGPGLGEGLWTFPGGFVTSGESVPDAVHREAMEEMEIELDLGELVGVYSRPEDRVVLVVYRATLQAGQTPGDQRGGGRGQAFRAGRAALGRAGLLVDRAGAARRDRAAAAPEAHGSQSWRALSEARARASPAAAPSGRVKREKSAPRMYIAPMAEPISSVAAASASAQLGTSGPAGLRGDRGRGGVGQPLAVSGLGTGGTSTFTCEVAPAPPGPLGRRRRCVPSVPPAEPGVGTLSTLPGPPPLVAPLLPAPLPPQGAPRALRSSSA